MSQQPVSRTNRRLGIVPTPASCGVQERYVHPSSPHPTPPLPAPSGFRAPVDLPPERSHDTRAGAGGPFRASAPRRARPRPVPTAHPSDTWSACQVLHPSHCRTAPAVLSPAPIARIGQLVPRSRGKTGGPDGTPK